MTKTLTSMFALFALMTLGACGSTATMVRRDPSGGRIQLAGAYMPAMADARMLMLDHCGGRFDPIELGQAVEFRCRHPRSDEHERAAQLAAR